MKVITIGRSEEHNDVVVNDDKVSRNHLQMVMDDQGNFSLMDLNSTNGTFVNGHRITGEVPLNVSDEVRIGNTVLPWQSYFGNQSNARPNIPSSPRTSDPHSSDSPQEPSISQPPKRWVRYAIVGAVALLILVGSGIGWKMYHINKKKKDLNEQIAEARRDSVNMEMNYQKAYAANQEAQAELERKQKIAAQSNSEKDKEALKQAQAKAEQTQKALARVEDDKEKVNQNVASLTSKLDELEKARDELNRKLDQAEEGKRSAEAGKAAAEKAREETAKSLRLTNQMQEELNKWNEEKAAAFCKNQNWSYNKNKKEAKNVIVEKFKDLDNATKEQKVKEMKQFNYKEKGNEDKKGSPKQKKAESTTEPQTSSPESQPVLNN